MYSRRIFIKHQAALGVGLLTRSPAFSAWTAETADMQLISPRDGDILHVRDGVITGALFTTKIQIVAPADSVLSVNGVPAQKAEGNFTATVSLTPFKNTLEITDEKSGAKKNITVYWFKDLADKYRLSIDDAIWFLKNIQRNAAVYSSIFDDPFLGFLKQVHQMHGTKVHVNLFYETEGFDLSQMTDQYKSEWIANANWLQLSFHAKAEMPDNPYKHAGYAQVKKECEAVITQIKRFAGHQLASPITTLHWGEVPVEVSRALRDCGYWGQLCDFNVDNDLPPCSYYLDVDQRRHINKRFLWRDHKEGITFIKSSIIIDTKKSAQVIPYLDQYEKESRKPPYVDLLVHEQYFYDYYHNYQPDYRAKVMMAVKWAKDNGYTPAFISECIHP